MYDGHVIYRIKVGGFGSTQNSEGFANQAYNFVNLKRKVGGYAKSLVNLYKKKEEKSFDFSSFCDSEAIRTLDPRLRRALLYPAELRNLPVVQILGANPFATAKIVCLFFCTKDFLAFF